MFYLERNKSQCLLAILIGKHGTRKASQKLFTTLNIYCHTYDSLYPKISIIMSYCGP